MMVPQLTIMGNELESKENVLYQLKSKLKRKKAGDDGHHVH
jgi:hypothetical protein